MNVRSVGLTLGIMGSPHPRYVTTAPTCAKKLAQHAIERQFLAFLSTLGELFRAHAHTGPSRANFFAHRTQPRADFETNNTATTTDMGQRETAITTARPSTATAETAITSAPKKRSKNAHSSPAKAMAVSTRRTCERAKAMAVSPQLEVEAVMVPPVSRRRRVAPNTQAMH